MTAEARLAFRAVVVDDEPPAREVVTTFLADEPRVQVVGQAGDGNTAVELVRRLRPELLFLDVQMPDRDGFGVLEALGDDVPPGVVFVTAHDEHALRAFEVHALDYLLKPFGRPRFEAAVDRALRRLEAEDALAARQTLKALLEGRRADMEAPADLTPPDPDAGARPASRRLGVRVGARTILVPVDEVDWAEADGDYVRLHAGGKAHLLTTRLYTLEEALGSGFLRIHRSVLVNLARVRELHRAPDGGGRILLDSDVQLRVARSRWEDLEGALELR